NGPVLYQLKIVKISAVCFLTASYDQVNQTPFNVYAEEEEVKMHCSHSIQSYDTILWYKQSEKQLQLLGYMRYDKGYPEAGVNVTMDGDARQHKNCILTIKYLKVSSSGVYFCAAYYHSAAHHSQLKDSPCFPNERIPSEVAIMRMLPHNESET
uniref:Immunoglobulin V-set domain-containing protein n=1 Tax=Astatotilapia calliptera TaxID=8154 RepID=A0AAX7V4N1_ASTCA